MPDQVREIRSQLVSCRDPECDGVCEPDQDGDHLMYECPECGYIFGYERVPQPATVGDEGGMCAIGVPESIRRAASAIPEFAMETLDRTIPLPTPVSIGRKSSA